MTKIRELVEKCVRFRLDPDSNAYEAQVHPEDLEYLVEDVVDECMTTILKESKWYWDKDEFESSNAIQNAARRVKEHFGIKE